MKLVLVPHGLCVWTQSAPMCPDFTETETKKRPFLLRGRHADINTAAIGPSVRKVSGFDLCAAAAGLEIFYIFIPMKRPKPTFKKYWSIKTDVKLTRTPGILICLFMGVDDNKKLILIEVPPLSCKSCNAHKSSPDQGTYLCGWNLCLFLFLCDSLSSF